MFAIEGFLKRGGKGFDAGVVHEHGGPRDGLQHRPMRARRTQKGDDQQRMANARKHRRFIGDAEEIVKRLGFWVMP